MFFHFSNLKFKIVIYCFIKKIKKSTHLLNLNFWKLLEPIGLIKNIHP